MKIKLGTHTINISPENSKMGKVHSFSVLPIITCAKGVPCTQDCYAIKMENFRECIRKTWEENTRTILEVPMKEVVNRIVGFIKLHDVKLFRWNVGGDFRLKNYFKITREVAKQCPETKFLAFTKCFEVAKEKRPSNYKLVLSIWHSFVPPTDCLNEVGFSYFDDGNENFPIPTDAKVCKDGCDKCMKCFNIKYGEKVVFKKH